MPSDKRFALSISDLGGGGFLQVKVGRITGLPNQFIRIMDHE